MTLHLPRGLPRRQAQFLCLLAVRPSLTRADYQRLLLVGQRTAKQDLAQLRGARLILPLGRGRDSRYTLGPAALITPGIAPQHEIASGPEDALQLHRVAVPFRDTFPVNIEPLFIPRSRS